MGKKRKKEKKVLNFLCKTSQKLDTGKGGKTILTQSLTEQIVTMGKIWIKNGPHGEIWC
jgi:hypothetical protein